VPPAAGANARTWASGCVICCGLYSRKLGWAVSPVVGEEVIRRLQIHDFPGNVRELEGLVDRALRQMPAFRPWRRLSPWPCRKRCSG